MTDLHPTYSNVSGEWIKHNHLGLYVSLAQNNWALILRCTGNLAGNWNKCCVTVTAYHILQKQQFIPVLKYLNKADGQNPTVHWSQPANHLIQQGGQTVKALCMD